MGVARILTVVLKAAALLGVMFVAGMFVPGGVAVVPAAPPQYTIGQFYAAAKFAPEMKGARS